MTIPVIWSSKVDGDIVELRFHIEQVRFTVVNGVASIHMLKEDLKNLRDVLGVMCQRFEQKE